MRLNKVIKLVIFIVICELAGIIGSFFTAPAISGWYAGLAKPALNPPGWVFGPVWTALYALMGIAVFLIWERGAGKALAVFGGQLFLNTIWSIIFFGAQNPGWALADLILLWLAIIWTMVLFFRISRLAGWLLLPYIIWVSFAGYLNYSIWILNLAA